MAFQIKNRKISTLSLNENNPRSIKDAKFQKLVANIQAFPEMLQIRPLVIDETGRVLGGNMRLQAAKHLGWTDIPTIDARTLTPEQRDAFIVLDNQDFGEWNFDHLGQQFAPEKLVEWGFEPAELGISFDAPKFIADGEETETEGLEIGDEGDYDASHVKMVQLFMTTETHPVFMAQCEALQAIFGTDNLTDTVLKAVEHANNNCNQTV